MYNFQECIEILHKIYASMCLTHKQMKYVLKSEHKYVEKYE